MRLYTHTHLTHTTIPGQSRPWCNSNEITPYSSEPEPHYQIQFRVIPRKLIPFFFFFKKKGGFTSLQRIQLEYSKPH